LSYQIQKLSAFAETLRPAIDQGYFANPEKSSNLLEVIIIYPIFMLSVNI
jgi:hypothetical protein